LTPKATKENATFLGWNTDKTATTALSSLKMNNSANLELFAIFKNKQPVTYSHNGGISVSKSNDLLYEGENVDLTPTAVKQNAVCLGWNTDPDAKTKLESLKMPAGPLMLYAIFKNKMQLTYNSNGGTTPSKETDWLFENDPVDLSPASTKTDAKFLGWNKNPNDTDSLLSLNMPNSNLTLFAIFNEKHTVSYNYTHNGGNSATKATSKLFEGDSVDLTPTATKTDAKFLGWNTNPSAKTGLASYKMPSTDSTLYAIFEDKIQVSYNYIANGGNSVSKQSNKYFAGETVDLSPTAAKTDAKFLGWNTDLGAKTVLTSYKMPSTDSTLYAIFEDKISVIYNFNANGGTSAAKTSDKIFMGDSVDLSPKATKSGWEFLGWNTDRTATIPLSSYTMPGNMAGKTLTLFAIYKLTSLVNFRDYDNSGVVNRGVSVITYNNDVPSPTTHRIKPPGPQNSPTAWTPLGWTHLFPGDAAPEIIESDGTIPFQNAYYGLYSHPVKLAYYANGGDFTPPPVSKLRFLNSYNINAPVNPSFRLEFAPKRANYTFAGWKKGDKTYAENENVTFGEDTTLTAAWDKIQVNGVVLSCHNLIVGTGETATIEAFVSPVNAANRDVIWSSSDPAVATVDQSGVVTAHKNGLATITATTQESGFADSCAVAVMFVATPVSHVTLAECAVTIFVGGERQLSSGMLPAGANSSVAWSSSEPTIAAVNQSGKVEGLRFGTATIVLKSLEGGKTATCDVTVLPVRVTGISLPKASLSMLLGDATKLTVTVSPDTATDRRYFWDSSDSQIASVDQNGNVSARQLGNATIVAKTVDGGFEARCDVTVDPVRVTDVALSHRKASMPVWDTLQLTATVLPTNATDKTIIWESSAPDIAYVDGFGKVTALKVGTAKISAVAADGSKKSSCTVTIGPIRISKIEIPGTMTILFGDIQQISAAISPINATDRTLVWQSDHSGIVSVDEEGRLQANQVGTATVTAKAADGGAFASCIVTV
jgi:uncharacterized repeat protein (TIGR02543 family)